MEIIACVALGLGLAAACGLRVFVPLTLLSLAAASGRVPVASGWEWIGALPTVIAFGTAMVLEVVAYMIPWLDHALDAIATPVALVAGMLASAAVVVDLPPLIKWSIVLIGGGGFAGLMQGATVVTRVKSSAMTAGVANPVVAILELVGAIVVSIATLLAPIAAIFVIVLTMIYLFRRAHRLLFGRRMVTSQSLHDPTSN